jgi:hypothetical protein
MTGWTNGKFVVKHYRRGDIMDGEAFVLVPERDPAAIVALLAYAKATPDPELSASLREWVGKIQGACTDGKGSGVVIDKIPGWVLTLAEAVEAETMTVESALFRIAGYALLEAGSDG